MVSCQARCDSNTYALWASSCEKASGKVQKILRRRCLIAIDASVQTWIEFQNFACIFFVIFNPWLLNDPGLATLFFFTEMQWKPTLKDKSVMQWFGEKNTYKHIFLYKKNKRKHWSIICNTVIFPSASLVLNGRPILQIHVFPSLFTPKEP